MLFRKGNKYIRGNSAILGMRPSGKHLNTCNFTRLAVKNGLIHRSELALNNGCIQRFYRCTGEETGQ